MLSSPHAARMERWLGRGNIEHLSASMRDWYGPPIAVHGLPGNVMAMRGGDFCGDIREGFECTAFDRFEDIYNRIKRGARHATSAKQARLFSGFASLSDLIAEATAGKRQEFLFNKIGPTGVANVTSSLWQSGPSPAAGGAGSAAPGGRVCNSQTVGGFPYNNPSSPDTLHFVSGYPLATLQNTLLLYDRLFDVAKTMSSTGSEAVSGVPTRYQGTSGAAAAAGNFLNVVVGATPLGATAHNWTTVTYTDHAGAGSTLPSLTGNASAITQRLDHPVNQWFAPLATGDTGIKALTAMQCSASVTGTIDFVIGHPIAWMPCLIANVVCVVDGINTAFNLARIFDDACLSFLEVIKPAATATTYAGSFTGVAG